MKKIVFLFLLTVCIVNANNQLENFDAFILKDLNKNSVIIAANQTKQIKPASLTKIMTAIIALESGKLNNKVTITKEMIQVEPSIAGYTIGEQIFLKDIVHSALISSSNDAAMSIAIYLGGSIDGFSKIMNTKAKKIGMSGSNFKNPSGLDHKEHFTTAKDLLALSEYAIKNKQFNEITKMKSYSYKSIDGKNYYAKTSNKLLNKHNKTIGIKTGYTSKAGPCLIARAKNGSKDLILIMLNSRINRWDTAERIFDKFL